MDSKNVKIHFFLPELSVDAPEKLIQNLFDKRKKGMLPATKVYNHDYEIRELVFNKSNQFYFGCIAKYRVNNIPKKAAPGESEEDVQLKKKQGLIEKSYFMFYPDNSLMLFQANQNGPTINQLASYLTYLNNKHTITFNPILKNNGYKRLYAKNTKLRNLRLKIAAPTNKSFAPKNKWNDEILDLLAGANAAYININVSGNLNSKNEEEKFLNKDLKKSIKELFKKENSELVKIAKVEAELGSGLVMPIDLVADRLFSKQIILMRGRYPDPNSVRDSLINAKVEKDSELISIFGEGDDSLS